MGTAKTAIASALLDPKIQNEAEPILKELGLSVSNFYELFYRQIIAQNGLPFELMIPNKKIMSAIENYIQGKGKTFYATDLLFEDLKILLMRTIRKETQFKENEKRIKNFNKIKTVVRLLSNGDKLPPPLKDHSLKGALNDCRECLLEPDWLMIYRIEGSELCLVRTGRALRINTQLSSLTPFMTLRINTQLSSLTPFMTLFILID